MAAPVHVHTAFSVLLLLFAAVPLMGVRPAVSARVNQRVGHASDLEDLVDEDFDEESALGVAPLRGFIYVPSSNRQRRLALRKRGFVRLG